MTERGVGAFELRQLLFDLVAQGFARAERASCCAGALDMTPHQFVRVQVGCIPGQEVQRQSGVSDFLCICDLVHAF